MTKDETAQVVEFLHRLVHVSGVGKMTEAEISDEARRLLALEWRSRVTEVDKSTGS